jgi:hypothetical protein
MSSSDNITSTANMTDGSNNNNKTTTADEISNPGETGDILSDLDLT